MRTAGTAIKLIAAIHRRPVLTHPEWVDHYRNRHGPLIATTKSFSRHLLRYDQHCAITIPLSEPLPYALADHDGVTEVWFGGTEDFARAFAEPDYDAFIRPDEDAFCDLKRVDMGLAIEALIVNENYDQPGIKSFVFHKRAGARDRNYFQQSNLEFMTKQADLSPVFKRYVGRYVRNHMLAIDTGLPGTESFDVVDEFRFRHIDDLKAFHAGFTNYSEETGTNGASGFMLATRGYRVAVSHI
jgi:hypothetical protein